jgi:hypothetical protein
MQDLYLKFPNESTAYNLLYEQVPVEFNENDEPTAWEPRQKYLNIDTLGIIYEGGEYDEDGNSITPPTALDGWHVNIRLMPDEQAEPLLPYTVVPAHPRRVWA